MKPKPHLLWLILPLLAAVLIAAADPPPTPAVTIKDMKFDPPTITIKVGQSVVWTNQDDRDHTVVATDGSFKSENIRSGGAYKVEFKKAGKFSYGCSYHPRMKGTVVVEDK